MIEEYILLGYRLEDPNRYETILYLIKSLLSDLYKNSFGSQEIANQNTITSSEREQLLAKAVIASNSCVISPASL